MVLFLFSLHIFGQCTIQLPQDTVICSNPINYLVSPIGSNFVDYQWNTGDTTQNITITQSGLYVLTATDNLGCVASDSIYVQTSYVSNVDLAQDLTLCGTSGTGVLFTANASLYVDTYTDSLRIIYDATNGVSGLVGANEVYMHSGAEFAAFGGWQTVVGNWGQDDGIGKMDSIAPNKWQITIYPQAYYNYAPGAALWGIFMVFRNADGSAVGKDNQNNDFYLDLHTNTLLPLSSYQLAMYANYTSSMPIYSWNTGDNAPFISPDADGTYSVVVSDINGCSATDSLNVQYFPYPNIDLGANVVLCANDTLVLNTWQ